MSVEGLCQICESAEAVDRCDRCGTLACDTHYEEDRGLCASCVAETGRGEEDTPEQGRQFDDDDVQGEYQF